MFRICCSCYCYSCHVIFFLVYCLVRRSQTLILFSSFALCFLALPLFSYNLISIICSCCLLKDTSLVFFSHMISQIKWKLIGFTKGLNSIVVYNYCRGQGCVCITKKGNFCTVLCFHITERSERTVHVSAQ